MATRAEVLSHITGRYETENLGATDSGMEVIKMGWRFQDGRTQLVFAGVGESHLLVMSPFAREDQITAEKALTQSTDFGVKIAFGCYCLTDVVPLENIDSNEIMVVFEVMPALADELEKNFGLGDDL